MTIDNLKINEEKIRDLYLRKLNLGEIEGTLTGKASIDKPWLKFYRKEKIKEELPQMTMYDYLHYCNIGNMDVTALDYYGRKVSYRELFDEISKAEKAFLNLGIREGDVVSVAMPFLPETVYSIYALNKLGAVVNMVDPRVPADKIKDYINGSNSKYLVMINLCYPKIERIYKDTTLDKVISVSPTDSLPLYLNIPAKIREQIKENKNKDVPISKNPNYITWKTFIKNGKKCDKDYYLYYEPQTPAVIIYTSGTSGEPKGAISSNDAFNNMAHFYTDSVVNVEPKDKFLLIMPPFIAYGLAIGLHCQLCSSQTLVMVPTFNIDNSAELLGNLVKKHKPQTIMGVPNFMVDLMKHPKMQNLDCKFLKNVIVGGDSMVPKSEELVNAFLAARRSEAVISKGWGLTEVNSCFTYTRDKSCNEIGSVGIPLLGNNVKVVKPLPEDAKDIDIDSLEELDYEEEGEIFIQSPTVINDYLNNREESERVFFISKKDGTKWVRTKDLGKITKDGLIYISGRMKRIIIRPDGHNVSPFAIENIINKNKMVENCAVVGRISCEHDSGSYPVAYVQIKDDYKGKEEEVISELQREISEKLPPRDIANHYEIIDEIPFTNIGKVDYKQLEEREKEKVKTLKRA